MERQISKRMYSAPGSLLTKNSAIMRFPFKSFRASLRYARCARATPRRFWPTDTYSNSSSLSEFGSSSKNPLFCIWPWLSCCAKAHRGNDGVQHFEKLTRNCETSLPPASITWGKRFGKMKITGKLPTTEESSESMHAARGHALVLIRRHGICIDIIAWPINWTHIPRDQMIYHGETSQP